MPYCSRHANLTARVARGRSNGRHAVQYSRFVAMFGILRAGAAQVDVNPMDAQEETPPQRFYRFLTNWNNLYVIPNYH
jgi:hypothetical protein